MELSETSHTLHTLKTERIQFLAPPGFKEKLQEEAAMAGISVGELIRQRLEPGDEEKELTNLTAALKKETAEVGQELSQALTEVDTLVLELQSRRKDAAIKHHDRH